MNSARVGMVSSWLLLLPFCLPVMTAQSKAGAQREHFAEVHQIESGGGGKDSTPLQAKPTLTTRELVSRLKKSLVMISTQDQEGREIAVASGFFIAPQLVATNLHVLKWSSKVYTKSATDGKPYPITDVREFSVNHDICVLYIADAAGLPLKKASGSVGEGDEILVAGNPEGLEATFSTGIVSGIRNEAGLFQIDAPISPGSSGGPVINRRGEAVGLAVSSLVSGQNLNFCSSYSLPHRSAYKAQSGRRYGGTSRRHRSRI